jgi:hypothetical protein
VNIIVLELEAGRKVYSVYGSLVVVLNKLEPWKSKHFSYNNKEKQKKDTLV